MRETGILELPKAFVLPLVFIISLSCTDLSEYDQSQVDSSMNDSLVVTTESWDVEMLLMQEGKARIMIEGSYAISYQRQDLKETRISGPVYVQLFDTLGSIET